MVLRPMVSRRSGAGGRGSPKVGDDASLNISPTFAATYVTKLRAWLKLAGHGRAAKASVAAFRAACPTIAPALEDRRGGRSCSLSDVPLAAPPHTRTPAA